MIKVAIVEDDRALREGTAALLRRNPDLEVTGLFESMERALPLVRATRPDIALVDIGLPGMSGIDGIRRIRAGDAGVQVLILTVYADEDHVFEAICAGACGYLLKDTSPEKLVSALREVHAGGAPMSPEIARKVLMLFRQVAPPRTLETQLSPRELEILRLLAEGHSYKTAADRLCLSLDTVRFHVRKIYDKLHVHSKSEAVLKALRLGLIY